MTKAPVGEYVRLALRLHPWQTARRAAGMIKRAIERRNERRRVFRQGSYAFDAPTAALCFRFHLERNAISRQSAEIIQKLATCYQRRQFDLLGSGWVEVRHGMVCTGVEDVLSPPGSAVSPDSVGDWLVNRVISTNRDESRRIWRLISEGYWAPRNYVPLDWQLDFKSGYRWSELDHHSNIRIGPAPGADIKVPWELARMQHLPQLALAYLAGTAPDDGLVSEIRAQILDFIATNPPAFGVNWACPMEVAIRATNLLVALDLLDGSGVKLDPPFLQVVARSILEHATHVLAHLEWAEEARSNHYLADIVGLLFMAAHLHCEHSEAWLGFALREFLIELELQFHRDGGNYEASTGYHRLSSEMALYGAALILGLKHEEVEAAARVPRRRLSVRPPQSSRPLPLHDPGDGRLTPLPPELWPRLARMAEFVADATKPTGLAVRIGDQDSARFIKLLPALDRSVAEMLREAPADHRHLLSLAGALLDRADLHQAAGECWPDGAAALALSGGRCSSLTERAFPAHSIRIGEQDRLAELRAKLLALPESCRRTTTIPLPPGALDGISIAAYPCFGLYVFRSPRLFLSLRCFDPAIPGVWSHSHDDNLAMEIQVDGRDLVTDPGSYVYTPFPTMRETYRQAEAHFVPRLDGYPVMRALSTFALVHLARAECLAFGLGGFAGCLKGAGWSVGRVVTVNPAGIEILDGGEPGRLVSFPSHSDALLVAMGYGSKSESSPSLL